MFSYYFRLIRLYNLLIGATTVCIMSFLLNIQNYYLIFLCSLEVMSIMAFGNLMNDYLDRQPDKINHPSRVLPQNKVNLKEVKLLNIILLILIFILSLPLNYFCQLLIYFLIVPLIVLYNFYLKNTPLLGNITIALLLGFIFMFSELALVNSIKLSILPFLLAFNLSLIREIIKDLHDYKGDLKHKSQTLPIVLGINKTCKLLGVYIVGCMLLFFLPYYYGFYGNLYLISLIFCIEIPLIYSVFLILNFQTQATFRQLSFFYKILSASGLFVILLSKG